MPTSPFSSFSSFLQKGGDERPALSARAEDEILRIRFVSLQHRVRRLEREEAQRTADSAKRRRRSSVLGKVGVEKRRKPNVKVNVGVNVDALFTTLAAVSGGQENGYSCASAAASGLVAGGEEPKWTGVENELFVQFLHGMDG